MRKRIKSLQPGDKIIDFGHPEEILRVDHGINYTAAMCEHNTYYWRDCDEQKKVKVLDE